VALQREIGDPHMLANFLSNLGDAARELGDVDEAERCYRESLVLVKELGERWLATYLLEDVAMLSALRGDAARAIMLAAAGARLRDEIGAPLPAESARKLDERLAAPRAELTTEEAAEAARAGASLSFEAAIETALESHE